MLSCSGESATRDYRVPASKSFNGYSFVVRWSWSCILFEFLMLLTLFCTYWSGTAREGNTNARFVTNSLQSDAIVKRPRRWITRYVFFAFISNRKFRSISLVRTRAILNKLPVPIIFLRSWHLGCVTQERLPFLFANRCIWILLQIPNMVDIISSWSIMERIRKN